MTKDQIEDVVNHPPPPPPPISEVKNRLVFRGPEVAAGEVPEDEGFINQNILNENSENVPVDVPKESTEVIRPDLIDVPEPQKEIFIIAEKMLISRVVRTDGINSWQIIFSIPKLLLIWAYNICN